ncbi:MAG: ATP-dependent DNA helicase RecG, partial [Pseudomonadota bacterium]
MRPAVLDPLFASVTTIEGVGPKIGQALTTLLPTPQGQDAPRIASLLFHLPRSVIDRTKRPAIMEAIPGETVTMDLRVDRHQQPPRGMNRAPYRVFCHDETGEIALTFFKVHGNWLERSLPIGEDVIVSGVVEWFNGRASMVHPDHMVLASKADELPLVEPVYPLVSGVASKTLQKAIRQAVDRVPALPEWIEPNLKARETFDDFGSALRSLHMPENAEAIDLESPARRRLAYDELLANQLALALMRRRIKRTAGRSLNGSGALAKTIRSAFGYPLTGAQERSL